MPNIFLTHPACRIKPLALATLAWMTPVWATLCTAAEDQDQPQITVQGVRIVGEPFAEEDSMRVFSWRPGTTIALLLIHPDGNLIELNYQESRLDQFLDDKTTSLVSEDDPGRIGGFPSISPDGTAALFEIIATGRPAQEAASLHATGKVIVNRGSTKRAHRSGMVRIRTDSIIEAGPIPFTISSVGKPKWGDGLLEIRLKTEEDDSTISKIRFFDSNGSQIPATKGAATRWRVANNFTAERTYRFNQRIKTFAVEIEYWLDLEKITVPFDITASVGF